MPKTTEDKRKLPAEILSSVTNGSPNKRRKKPTIENSIQAVQPPTYVPSHSNLVYNEPQSNIDHHPTKKRINRLEQNRRAAKVSRERKKYMVDELQRSVSVFQSANASLMVQNEEVVRLLGIAQKIIDDGGDGKKPVSMKKQTKSKKESVPMPVMPVVELYKPALSSSNIETHLPLVKSEHIPEIPGNGVNTTDPTSETFSAKVATPIQPDAIMQAMSNFQQAATDAMFAAMQAMNQNPTANQMDTMSYPIPDAQQAYMDNMAALAIQNSLGSANPDGSTPNNSSIMLGSLPFKMGPFFTWQQQTQQNHLQQ